MIVRLFFVLFFLIAFSAISEEAQKEPVTYTVTYTAKNGETLILDVSQIVSDPDLAKLAKYKAFGREYKPFLHKERIYLIIGVGLRKVETEKDGSKKTLYDIKIPGENELVAIYENKVVGRAIINVALADRGEVKIKKAWVKSDIAKQQDLIIYETVCSYSGNENNDLKPFVKPLEILQIKELAGQFGVLRRYENNVSIFHEGDDYRKKAEILEKIEVRDKQGKKVKKEVKKVTYLKNAKSISDGIIRKATVGKGFRAQGKVVIIEYPFGIFARYYHLKSVEVKEGQIVKSGQVIGEPGRTGEANGDHLHFQVDVNCGIVDPQDFIEKINKILE